MTMTTRIMTMTTAHHDHDHADDHDHAHGASNVLMWHEDIAFEGCAVRLGQHGLVVQSGTELEPAVSIERDGQPVTDATISVSLLDAEGKKNYRGTTASRF